MQTSTTQVPADAYGNGHQKGKKLSTKPSAKKFRSRQGEPVPLPTILVVRWDDVKVDTISMLFANRGYLVRYVHVDHVEDKTALLESYPYEAIVHTAGKASTLEGKLDDNGKQHCSADYVLIAKDDIDDIQCVVQLTAHASTDLKAYVRALWAMCSVT